MCESDRNMYRSADIRGAVSAIRRLQRLRRYSVAVSRVRCSTRRHGRMRLRGTSHAKQGTLLRISSTDKHNRHAKAVSSYQLTKTKRVRRVRRLHSVHFDATATRTTIDVLYDTISDLTYSLPGFSFCSGEDDF